VVEDKVKEVPPHQREQIEEGWLGRAQKHTLVASDWHTIALISEICWQGMVAISNFELAILL
jgi:hypothetical protein